MAAQEAMQAGAPGRRTHLPARRLLDGRSRAQQPTQEPEATVDLGEALKALADPTRWEIVTRLAATDDLTCGDLLEVLTIGPATLSHHAQVLGRVGLICVRKEGRTYHYALCRPVAAAVIRSMHSALVRPTVAP